VTNSWSYYRWLEAAPVPLKASDVLVTQSSPTGKKGDPLHHLIRYADMYYVACRILMLASYQVHPPALYAAGQAAEKYMKALLLHLTGTYPRGHDLTDLAARVHEALVSVDPASAPLFTDREFVELCQHLTEFDIAGRYQPRTVDSWRYHLNLLGFLDAFVVKCRELLAFSPAHPNVIRSLLMQNSEDNQVMAAAINAFCDNNHYTRKLSNPAEAQT
jgi:HEPN domain-containing protein